MKIMIGLKYGILYITILLIVINYFYQKIIQQQIWLVYLIKNLKLKKKNINI